MQKTEFPILMYHSISNMPKGTFMRSLHVSPKRFAFQMYLLKLLGYRGVSIGELYHQMISKKPKKLVGISFDDGYKNNISNALPILKKFGFTATVYLVSNNIGGSNHWDVINGIKKQKLLNENDINQWINSGMEIGSHSQNHSDLTNCSNEAAEKEIIQSKIDLEKRFKIPINHFCYPYGNFNNSIINVIKKAGYSTATTTKRGRSKHTNNLLALPRVQVTHHTLPHLFLLKILTKYEDKRNNR
jgi:peptidoglycan/xylan/chitin deacetylase (PgdA/CDA1 family)